MQLDARAIGRGALGVALLFAPVVIVLRALAGGDSASYAWLGVLVALPLATSFGGWVACYDRPSSPLAHGALAGALGLLLLILVLLPFRLASGNVTLVGTVIALVLLQVAAVFGLLGGLLAVRGVRMTRQ
jgi:hypothetical protein